MGIERPTGRAPPLHLVQIFIPLDEVCQNQRLLVNPDLYS